MKKWIITICLVVGLAGLLIVGCEVESTEQFIEQAKYQATDPCSPVQQTAEKLQGLIKPAVILVQTAAATGFPYAKVILSALAAIEMCLLFILGLQKKTTNKALAETTAKYKAANQGMELFRYNNTDKAAELYKEVGDARTRIGVGV